MEPIRYRTILVGTDLSDLAQLGVQAGLAAASRLGAERVHLAAVVPMPPAYLSTYVLPVPALGSERLMRETVSDVEKRLDALKVEAPPGVVLTREARVGIPPRELESIAGSLPADLVIVATHPRGGFRRFFLGSVADALIRVAPCPVLAVGPGREGTALPKRILAAVDLSPASEGVLAHAFAMAGEGTSILVLSLLELPTVASTSTESFPLSPHPTDIREVVTAHQKAVEEHVERVGKHDRSVEVDVHVASPLDAVLETAQQLPADLIVVGTSGHNAWQRMLVGSTANRVLSHAKCPVLVVPHDVAEQAVAH
jgi:nucleotide-binding universal stress UspA family protein